jgi:hypothetical protein
LTTRNVKTAQPGHGEHGDDPDLAPGDGEDGDEREQSEHERVLGERRADGISDVDVPLSLEVGGDRIGDLG